MFKPRYIRNFILKFKDKIHFSVISDIDNLSEKFIDEFKDILNWSSITQNNAFIK